MVDITHDDACMLYARVQACTLKRIDYARPPDLGSRMDGGRDILTAQVVNRGNLKLNQL